jgi:hypothetical protein
MTETETVATLIYDSWTNPVPELRTYELPDRHLIFEGNGLILDLLLKTQGSSTCIHVGGQVLPEHQSLGTVSDVAIVMERGTDRSLTRTNALGEFAFHFVPNGRFDLVITFRDHRFVVRGLSNDAPRAWRVSPLAEG